MGAYFWMGAYKRDVVVVIKMGAYIHGVLILWGAYYPDFTVDLVLEDEYCATFQQYFY